MAAPCNSTIAGPLPDSNTWRLIGTFASQDARLLLGAPMPDLLGTRPDTVRQLFSVYPVRSSRARRRVG
jgi:hypothetical protein